MHIKSDRVSFCNVYRRGFRTAIECLSVVLLIMIASTHAYAQDVFKPNLSIATGISTDRTGKIYVDSDGLFTTYISKFSQAGNLLARKSLGGVTVGNLGHIARIPGSDDMLLLTQLGDIYAFGPNLGLSKAYDLSFLAYQVAFNVYDVNLGFNGSLVLGAPDWGDIAAFWASPTLLYVYATSTTNAAGGFPFVLRLAIDYTRKATTWRVVVKSSGTAAGNVNVARGIAVNSAGWVLTGFPYPGPGGFFDSLAAFKTSFPEVANTNTLPRFILRTTKTVTGYWDMASMGMTTDEAGNFYVATGVVGSSLCGFYGSGALVLINRNPTVPNPRCFTLSALLSRSRDVAVSPVDNTPYMTVDNRVVKFHPLVTTAVANTDAQPAPIPQSPARGLLGFSAFPLVQER